jgi:peptidoglycan lytic transglycosylase
MTRAALASEASGQRGNSMMRAPDTRPEPGSSARGVEGFSQTGLRGGVGLTGDGMGRRHAKMSFGAMARASAVAVGCVALAHCSGPFAGKESKYSPRVIEDGEPVPKGGGNYRVGKAYNINGRTYVPTENPNYRAEGIASWYGPDFHGRLTANGEVYDMHAISAAHTTMPLPSYARVTNLENSRSIIVRVNDRGPYVRDRLIDLSIGTAKALDFYGHGLTRVRVEYVGRAPLEGSDDRMLMATLREGTPAPAPSRVMVASARPFISNIGDGAGTPLPPERPFTLGSSAGRNADMAPREVTSTGSPPPKPRASAPAATDVTTSWAESPLPSAPSAGFAPAGGTLGLMSGRGLY